MGSERLPGKTLVRIGDKPILAWVIERLRHTPLVDRIVVATSTSPEDDAVEQVSRQTGVFVFRGSEEDVLDRFVKALEKYPADAVIRATADNPLLDPSAVTAAIKTHKENMADYTGLSGVVPMGTGAEIVSSIALHRAWEETREKAHREHVTTYIHTSPSTFRLFKAPAPDYLVGRDHRLTVDTEEDLDLMRKLHDALKNKGEPFDAKAATKLLDESPELARLNRNIEQKDWRREL